MKKMKKLTYLLVTMFMIAAIVSCSKESTNDNELVLLKKATAITQPTASFPTSNGGTTPYLIPGANPGGNRTCAEVATAWKLDPNPFICGEKIDYSSGVFAGLFPSGLSVTTDGKYVSFDLENCILIGDKYYKVGAVIVKGGNASNVYYYPNGTLSDGGLAAPYNASGTPAGLSNLTFCFIECEKDLIIAVKVIAENGIWGITDGEKVFNQGSCEFIGINPYPFTADLILKDPYWGFQMGTVSLIDSKIKITLNAGLTLTAAYIYIGTKADLINPLNLIYGCPDYQNWTLYQDWD